MIRKIYLFLFTVLFSLSVKADEGLWLPVLLEQLNQSDMQSMGLKLTAEDIYSVNHSSLKDAVCLFGGGCTAEVVSDKGLILTNHHCGYSSIQAHSSLDNNYLEYGYWAKDFKDELSNPGLTVTFLISMKDVTSSALEGVTATMSEKQRSEIIKKNTDKIEKEAVINTHYKAKVKPFYYGSEFYLFITEVFTDIRLVGTPPNSIGNFGGDTDNWEYPRHTGDFCVFRIYANDKNAPADYSENNIPYKPKKSCTISLKGVKEGDFTMVYGYPGHTEEYLTSYGVNLVENNEDPLIISIRDKKLKIMQEAMKSNPFVKLQYSAKYAGIANYWKKFLGESKGLKKTDAVDKKKKMEQDFELWVNADKTRNEKYGNLLPAFEKIYKNYTPLELAYDIFSEDGYTLDLLRYAIGFSNLISKSADKTVKDEDVKKLLDQYKNGAAGFFKNYDLPTDKKIFTAMIDTYYNYSDVKYQPGVFKTIIKDKFNGDVQKYSDYVYQNSSFVSNDKVQKALAGFKRKKISKLKNDPAFKLATSIYNNFYDSIVPLLNQYTVQLDSLYRVYVTALREMQPSKMFYPDANSTLRLSYGKVAGYKPADGVDFLYYTTLKGVFQKEDTTIDDYKVPLKLKELYEKKDYGIYSSDNTMHVAFIAANHTSGGNSGSPVFNGSGQLIGINFDRVWQGTMSDIMFDPDQCRNITLDIRYVLFIIDKYAECKRLINEMNIAE